MSPEALLNIHVIPRARRTEVAGTRGDAWLVRLQAPPVEGAANEALIEFLAKTLRVAKRAVSIVSGEQSRQKRVRISGVAPATAAEVLNRASPNAGSSPPDRVR